MVKDTLLTGSAGIAVNTLTTDTIQKGAQMAGEVIHATPVTTWTNLGIAVCTLLGIIIQTFFRNNQSK